MSKKNGNNKNDQNPIPTPSELRSKPKKRRLLTAGIAALALAGAVAGTAYLGWYNRLEKPETEQKISASEQASLRDLWMQRYDETGTDLIPTVMQKYDLYRQWDAARSKPKEELESIEKRLSDICKKASQKFAQDPKPENNTGDCLFYWFKNALEHCKFFVPQKVVDIFNITESSSLLNALKEYQPRSDPDLVRKMLSFASLLVYQRMDIKEYTEGPETLEGLLLHLRQGKGDCSDYTYAIANLYFAACELRERPELVSRIRTVLGIDVNNGKTGLHTWIQIQDSTGKWDNIEANHDILTGDIPFNLDTQALYTFENGKTNWRIPLVTIQHIHDGKNKWEPIIRAHQLPD